MFEITIEAEFCAAHALVVAGVREAIHGHNWRVTVTVGALGLDADGLLIDFHQLQSDVAQILAPFHNANLNTIPPFDLLNPSAELVAKHIGDSVQVNLSRQQKSPQATGQNPNHHVRLVSVRVTEAPGCSAVYRL